MLLISMVGISHSDFFSLVIVEKIWDYELSVHILQGPPGATGAEGRQGEKGAKVRHWSFGFFFWSIEIQTIYKLKVNYLWCTECGTFPSNNR